jgi:hypothetical protein
MKKLRSIEKIEQYLEGKLQGEELHHFEEQLKTDKRVKNLFHCYKQAIEIEIQKYAETCLLNSKSPVSKNSII